VSNTDEHGLGQLAAHQSVNHEFHWFVERGGCFVEEDHLRLGQQDSGERDALLLAGGEHLGPVVHLVEPVGV
jgi:hypothetical protein